jgi:hypothetical protein
MSSKNNIFIAIVFGELLEKIIDQRRISCENGKNRKKRQIKSSMRTEPDFE